MEKQWWQDEVCYQIYPKSFMDSNGDGIGDLKGITSKLDYLKDLGVTMLWLCPVYESPMDDNGYDVSDYEAIYPAFGTMEDMEELIKKAKDKGIKVIMDLVMNHTSDEHAWFKEALADKNSKYRNYYIFKEGKNGKAPTNWRSIFGGSVWEKVADEENMFYMHSFSKKQPDLNWENSKMRKDIYGMIHRWLDKGIAGFRVDAINFIKKDQRFQDGPVDGVDGLSSCVGFTRNMPGIEEFYDEIRKEAFNRDDCMTVSESVGVDYKDAGCYIGDNGCFSMLFDFNYANIDVEDEQYYKPTNWQIKDLRNLIYTSQLELQKIGWSAPFIENHDHPRAINKYIKDEEFQNYYGATALAVLYFLLRGTPFIYQGQELGMTNFKREDISEFDDLAAHSQYQTAQDEGYSKEEALGFLNARSRDHARTPFPWTKNGGFTTGTSWIKPSDLNYKINAEDEEKNPDSVLNFYKKLIALRQSSNLHEDLVYGDFIPLKQNNDSLISYQRGKKAVIAVNLSKDNAVSDLDMSKYTPVLNSYKEIDIQDGKIVLKPYQALVLQIL